MALDNIIQIRGLCVDFPLSIGTIRALNGVDLDIPRGAITALVGESGSGKSTIASAMLNLVSNPGVIRSGSIMFEGQDVLQLKKEALRQYRWQGVSLVFQAAQNCLNPILTIGDQIIETYVAHGDSRPPKELLSEAAELLKYVRLEPGRVLRCFPHELSGGMKQRVMIVFALLLKPKVLILDEPTTALDVITQDYIFDILVNVHKELGLTMMLLTHDIAIVSKVADYVGVMYAGRLVEFADVFTVFKRSVHPYTEQLVAATPSLIDSLEGRRSINGSPPDLLRLPAGCTFGPRCESHTDKCNEPQPLITFGENHLVRCCRARELQEAAQ
jgi:peptide/nickel transport system ATP-binding protein